VTLKGSLIGTRLYPCILSGFLFFGTSFFAADPAAVTLFAKSHGGYFLIGKPLPLEWLIANSLIFLAGYASGVIL
jgi:hypothetical protein